MKSLAMPVFSSLVTASILTVAGCGGAPTTIAKPSSTYPNVSGNYQLTATSTVKPGTTAQIGGSLTQSAGSVSGVMHVTSSCYNFQDDLVISGNVKTDGTLVLTSSAVAGQILTVKGTISPDGSSLSGGIYSIAGGCADQDKGCLTGGTFPPVSGTYRGSYLTPGKAPVQVTAPLTESVTPDAHGFFHVSGSTTFVGSSCFTQGSIVTPATDSILVGSQFGVVLKTDEKNPSTVIAGGTFDSTAKTFSGTYTVHGGACDGDVGTGSITLQ